VDDEQDISLILKIGLEKHGFAVTTFNDPVVALSGFREGDYDMILLDIRMPMMDGFKLYEELRLIDGKVKVCFMTAFEVYYDALKELFPGSYLDICFVRKPLPIDEFADKISKEINKPAMDET
jgi:DNA-binding response OmpR family regulator